jgi:putative restriction endonuclease
MVRLFVAITDRDWFDVLAREALDEVNFWQPSGRHTSRALQPGELLLFKLHVPDDLIVGGVFSHGSLVPLSLAWEAFETCSGASSLAEMRRHIARYRREVGPLGTGTCG